jgi:Mor family transcriptional regulator
MKPFGYIYLISNLVNGKLYIGKTESTINERWYTHKWRANHLDRVENPLVIDLAIAKYGENSFEINELDKAFNKEDLLRAEAYWIKFYDATNPDKGYNRDPMGEIIYSDDYESIWQIPNSSEKRNQKYIIWRESLIKKKIPKERQQEFKKDIKYLSGVQLEKKYGLYSNRRALLREIRRILQNENIETIEQAKEIVGGNIYNPKKIISPEMEDRFIRDFKLLKGVELENKYNMSRGILIRNIKEIFRKRESLLLENVSSLEGIKIILDGKIYSIPKKIISPEREQEFIQDVNNRMKRRDLCKKYEIGTNVFYRELRRLCNVNGLRDKRKISWNFPQRQIKYVPSEKENEFVKDLKSLSGVDLQIKYNISDRRILLREIRRICNNENLNSMEGVKKYVGGKVYDRETLKKEVQPEMEFEFKNDVKLGLTSRELCDKYGFGTKVLYKELKRLLNEDSLKEARNKK